MSSRSLHRSKERIELTVFGLVLAALVLAWALMFVHPTGAFLVFIVGFTMVGGSAVLIWALNRAERRASRTELASHVCPGCGAGIRRDRSADAPWRCVRCGAEYATIPGEVEERSDAE